MTDPQIQTTKSAFHRPARRRRSVLPALTALLLAGGALTLAPVPAAAQDGWQSPGYEEAADRDIQELQRALDRAGYDPGPIDGRMGPGTRDALRDFQRDNALPVTGRPTAQVRAALMQYMDAGVRQRDARGREYVGDRGGPDRVDRWDADLIADVQFALRRQGYDIPVDGQLDIETRAAIRDFQRNQDLRATGTPDRRLLTALGLPADRTTDQRMAGEPWPDRADRAGNEPPRWGDRQRADEAWDPDRRPDERYADGRYADRRWDDERLSYGELVRRTEAELNRRGYQTGPVDQRLDAQSARAIQTYQDQRGLDPTGEPSRELLADIRQSDLQAPPPTAADLATGIIGSIIGGAQQQEGEASGTDN